MVSEINGFWDVYPLTYSCILSVQKIISVTSRLVDQGEWHEFKNLDFLYFTTKQNRLLYPKLKFCLQEKRYILLVLQLTRRLRLKHEPNESNRIGKYIYIESTWTRNLLRWKYLNRSTSIMNHSVFSYNH